MMPAEERMETHPPTLHPASHYAHVLRPHLPAGAFEPVRNRLVWLLFHIALIVLGTLAVVRGWGGLPAALLLSLCIGHAFAGLAFVGHETMHGAVVRHRGLRYLVGYVAFLPFCLPPRVWVAWHNKVHHGNTGRAGVDPDAFPTLEQYREMWLARMADLFAVGRGRPLGVFTLLIGFTGQSSEILWMVSRQRGYLSRREHNIAILEWLLAVGFWTTIGMTIGGRAFVFAFVLPLLVANAIVMSYIVTNHWLSPHTPINDPLVNSLSVTTPRWMGWLHLNFGLHAEHHLFPSMSSAHAPAVRELLIALWPERYRSMPFGAAMRRMWSTPRVYKTDTVLVDMRDGYEHRVPTPDGAHALRAAAPGARLKRQRGIAPTTPPRLVARRRRARRVA
jgi:fatty acid desaturase